MKKPQSKLNDDFHTIFERQKPASTVNILWRRKESPRDVDPLRWPMFEIKQVLSDNIKTIMMMNKFDKPLKQTHSIDAKYTATIKACIK